MRFGLCTLAVVTLCACGSDGDGNSNVDCSTIPACYADALSALQACVVDANLTLGSVSISSGVVQGLECNGPSTTVQFSDFSANENGTVPLPSNTTILSGGTECATLGSVTGFSQNSSGMRLDFVGTTIDILGREEVTVRQVDGGGFTLLCGGEEFDAAPGAFDSCAPAVQAHEVVRDTTITQMSVRLVDASGSTTDLLVCN